MYLCTRFSRIDEIIAGNQQKSWLAKRFISIYTHTEIYSKLIEKYMVRHFVKPGMTGWAQTTGYRGETKELWQMEERVKRDIWYIEQWTIWLDFRIMWLTIKNVFIKENHAY